MNLKFKCMNFDVADQGKSIFVKEFKPTTKYRASCQWQGARSHADI